MEELFDPMPYIERLEELVLRPVITVQATITLNGRSGEASVFVYLTGDDDTDWLYHETLEGTGLDAVQGQAGRVIAQAIERSRRQLSPF